MTEVFIVWDQSRKEYGEIAELLDVFETREAAERYVNDDPDCCILPEEASIEERKVRS